ncbi:MAG: type I-C CRISPR-associated protein Cas8c/Csd1, partial [Snowella sp.]
TKFSLPIKGVLGTTTQGGSLISAYSSACSSYKLSGALVSPISAIADEQFSQALNYLLREDRHHLTIGNITYVFWSDSGKIDANFFESPDDPSVKDYLGLVNQADTPIHPEWQIHILALTGNSGRLVVRDWMEIKELDGCIPLWQPGKYDLMSRPIEVLNFKPLPNEYNYSMSKLGCSRIRLRQKLSNLAD